MSLRVESGNLFAESERFSARFDGTALVSMQDRASGVEFCRPAESLFPLELYYTDKDTLAIDRHQRVTTVLLSEYAARIIITGEDTDRELFVRLDQETGDLCVTPSGQSARRGLVSVRWNVSFVPQSRQILPCVNGLLIEADRSFPGNQRFPWPHRWNAQLAIAECDGRSLMIHSEDTECRFKALNLWREQSHTALGFESEQLGPLWDNRNAGGVEWRINTYEGDWRTPADRYRAWMERTYDLTAKRAARPDWVDEISLAVCWCSARAEILDALAAVHPPERILIHLSNWRKDKYDINYPEYAPSDETEAFMAKANAMGFKVMPHFNYFACDLKHPLFAALKPWQLRDPYRNEPQAWNWPFDTYDYTRMGYVHPGLALWRRILTDNVLKATRQVRAPIVFLDQTLCTWNTDNGQIENMNTIQGMRQLQEELTAIWPELMLAGEGCTEISFHRQCFAQGHIYGATWDPLDPQHIDVQHNIGAYLWQGHTRLLGYYHLNPMDPDVDIAIEVYRRMDAIPTMIPRNWDGSPGHWLQRENPAMRKLLDLAEAKA